MTCRAATGFVYHDLDFTQPAPYGLAHCRRCKGAFTIEQWAEWPCPGAQPEVPVVRFPFGAVPCSLCSLPVVVDPMHRAIVEWFGTTCAECFLGAVTAQ